MSANDTEYSVGNIVRMKKIHACGGSDWRILRMGADFKILCLKCGRELMLTRQKFEKAVKQKL